MLLTVVAVLRALHRDVRADGGVTRVEYGIMLALIAAIVAGVITISGPELARAVAHLVAAGRVP